MIQTIRFGLFTKFIAMFLVVFFTQVGLANEKKSKDILALEEKIGQAKILYYNFQFKKSEDLLNEVIVSLKNMSPSPVVNHNLSEAYLRLALNQDAQSLSKQMQESLYQSVTYEPTRELKTEDFAPSVIAQFNKAKQKYLLSQGMMGNKSDLSLKSSDVKKQKGESQPLGQNTEKKKKSFFKSWPFFVLLGVVVAGGAAGAALALGGGGGGGGGSGPVTVGGTPQ